MTEVTWRAAFEDDCHGDPEDGPPQWIVDRSVTKLGDWVCEANADSAVTEICETFWRGFEWDEYFEGEASVDLMIEILEPHEIAGWYYVDLVLMPKASVRKRSY